MAGRESKLGKALFLLNQARAVGEVIINTAIANSKAVAASFITGGQPWVTINSVMAAANIASILGQTVGEFTGKKEGGYTGRGSDDDIADFVHANEFVANADAVRNPTIKPILDMINLAQKSGSVANVDFSRFMTRGKSDGGYTTSNRSGSPSPTLPINPINPDLLNRLTNAIERFEKKKLVVYTELIKKDLDTLDGIERNRGM
jgi:hypothetical protein